MNNAAVLHLLWICITHGSSGHKSEFNMQIERYLTRLDFRATPKPDVATLHDLHRAHMQAVPFENLDIHLGRKIVLDENLLFRKIVERRRGGICYELNGLFARLLTDIGFNVSMVAAEVFKDDGTTGPLFDHMALLVEIDNERYLADVGFGDSFIGPLRLSDAGDQTQDRRIYRIQQDANMFTVMAESGVNNNVMKPSFRFSTQPRQLSDFDEMCTYHQTSVHSHFTRKEICSRATLSGRITLSGTQLIETANGSRSVVELASIDERRQALIQHFGISL
ncbi:arylamine N-acetyltransferase [Paraburkholderia acidicola]|uniref:Arylamine N-acetyltransferase n=1 Tax=Paraburkholderia acidicola TaxID=1912599 RepID=A0ABV1LRL9_9BURK